MCTLSESGGGIVMKKILFAASEGVPFIKTGGLADVVGSLPKCIDKNYFDVRVIIPKYACMKQEMKDKMRYAGHFYMDFNWKNEYVGILEAEVDGVHYYFIDNEYYFSGSEMGDREICLFLQGSSIRTADHRLPAGCHSLPRLADGTDPCLHEGAFPRRRLLQEHEIGDYNT